MASVIVHSKFSNSNSNFIMFWLILCGIISSIVSINSSSPLIDGDRENILSRRRRYVAFPDGSSVSAALCMTIGVLGNPHVSFLSYAINWGVAYNLPNYDWAKEHAHGFQKNDTMTATAVMQRRTRRELYDQIAIAMDSMGFNGPACVERALCESAKYWQLSLETKGTGTMVEEIVRLIFSFPTMHVHSHEPDEVHHYDRVYRRSRRDILDCAERYNGCHFSLLELALGRYIVPPEGGGSATFDIHPFAFM